MFIIIRILKIKNNIIKAINNIPPVNMEYNYNSLVTLRKEIEKQKLDYFIKNQPNSSQTRSELKKILNENKNSNVLLDWVIKNYPTIEKIGPQKFDNNFPGPFNSTFNDLDYIQSNKSWDDFKENNLHDKHYPNSAYLYNNNQSTIGNWNLIKPLDLIHAGVNFHENRLILD